MSRKTKTLPEGYTIDSEAFDTSYRSGHDRPSVYRLWFRGHVVETAWVYNIGRDNRRALKALHRVAWERDEYGVRVVTAEKEGDDPR